MAGELNLKYVDISQTIKAIVYGPDRKYMWDGSDMALVSATADEAAWRVGLITCTETQLTDSTRTGTYVGNFPAIGTAGEYIIEFFLGASPSPGDFVIGVQTIWWDGSAAVSPAVPDKIGYELIVAYDAAKTASQAGDEMDITTAVLTKFVIVDTGQTEASTGSVAALAGGISVVTVVSGSSGAVLTDICTKADIEAIFGADNVAKWADKDEDQNTTKINTRIASAIDYATADFYDRLRGGVVTIPFTSFDRTSVDLCSRLAGVWLYEAWGLEDSQDGVHLLTRHRKHAYGELERIRTGVRRLDQTTSKITTPGVVNSSDWD